MYTCPVCFFDGMTEPPQDYYICECCGTEFGTDDEMRSHSELRTEWLALGAKWFYGQPPTGWNPWKQSRIPAYAHISGRGSACRNVIFTSGTHVYSGTTGGQASGKSASRGSIEVFTCPQSKHLALAF
jgi:hypothetical protein